MCKNFYPDQVHEIDAIDRELHESGHAIAIVTTLRLWKQKPGGRADALGVDELSITADLLVTPDRHFEILALAGADGVLTCMDCRSAIDAMQRSPLESLATPVATEAKRVLAALASPHCMSELYTELDAATCARLAPDLGCAEFLRRRRARLEASCALFRGTIVDDSWNADTRDIDVLVDNGHARAWVETSITSDERELCSGGIDGNKLRARPDSLAEH